MKKLFMLLCAAGVLLCVPLHAQTAETAQSADQTEQAVIAADSTATDTATEAVEAPYGFRDFMNDALALIIVLIVLLAPLAMIVHMVIVNWKTRRLKKMYTSEEFAAKRVKKEWSEQMTESEVETADLLLDEANSLLSVVETDDEGNEWHKPGKMRELLRFQKKLDEVTLMLPTDPEVLERYNNARDFLYDYLRRSFFASWKLIVLCFLVAIGVSFTGDTFWKGFITYGAFFWAPAIVYWLSSQVPQYMIDRKNERGGGNGWFSTALVGLGLGVLGSGYTVRTHYTDGTHSDDHSGHWIALFLGLMVLIAVAFTIYLWAILNYLRNYLLYW